MTSTVSLPRQEWDPADLVTTGLAAQIRRPTCLSPRTTAAVVNIDAGGMTGLRRRALIAALRQSGLVAADRILLTTGTNLAATLRAAAAFSPDVVMVCGGDGTARTALETLTPLRIATAPLPGGTLNRLVATIYGHSDFRRILRQIGTGGAGWIPAGLVAGQRFFVVSGYGAPMRLNQVREAVREGHLKTAWDALRTVSRTMFHQRFEVGGSGQWANCSIVALGPVDAAFGLAPPQPREGFEIASAALAGWGAAVALAPFALLGGWRQRRGITAGPAKSIVLKSQVAAGLPALLDGEPTVLPPEVTITYEAKAGLIWR